MKDMLFAVVGLAAAGVAIWQIIMFTQQTVPRGQEANHWPIIIGVICAIIALICGGLFMSGRVNKQEEIHVTE